MTSKVDLKVVMLGAANAGKTCLCERFLYGKYDEGQNPTVGAAFGSKSIRASGQSVVLGVWDTAGSERYKAMSRIYFRSAGAALVSFDITDQKSFEDARGWIDEVKGEEPDCKIYLAECKSDLEEHRVVTKKEVENFAREIGCRIFSTSAKTGQGIDVAFSRIANDFVEEFGGGKVKDMSRKEVDLTRIKKEEQEEEDCSC